MNLKGMPNLGIRYVVKILIKACSTFSKKLLSNLDLLQSLIDKIIKIIHEILCNFVYATFSLIIIKHIILCRVHSVLIPFRAFKIMKTWY